MRRQGNLLEQIVTFENLLVSAKKAALGKKRKLDTARFLFHLETQVLDLQRDLLEGTWEPGPYHVFRITDPKPRVIAAAPFKDRVVHHALCRVTSPLLERGLIHDSYACRTGKGSHAAIKKAQTLSKNSRFYLKCDISKYFESINHQLLYDQLARLVKDPAVLHIFLTIINHQVPGSMPGQGLPIGNLTSQYFANLYLSPMDHFIKEQLCIKGYLRYMDDYVLFHESKIVLRECLKAIQDFLESRLRLSLKEKALSLSPVGQGLSFLGFRVYPEVILLQTKKWVRFKRAVTKMEQAYLEGSLDEHVLASSVTSRVGHLQHADTLLARKAFFMGSLNLG